MRSRQDSPINTPANRGGQRFNLTSVQRLLTPVNLLGSIAIGTLMLLGCDSQYDLAQSLVKAYRENPQQFKSLYPNARVECGIVGPDGMNLRRDPGKMDPENFPIEGAAPGRLVLVFNPGPGYRQFFNGDGIWDIVALQESDGTWKPGWAADRNIRPANPELCR